jgi:hypothetical protein
LQLLSSGVFAVKIGSVKKKKKKKRKKGRWIWCVSLAVIDKEQSSIHPQERILQRVPWHIPRGRTERRRHRRGVMWGRGGRGGKGCCG